MERSQELTRRRAVALVILSVAVLVIAATALRPAGETRVDKGHSAFRDSAHAATGSPQALGPASLSRPTFEPAVASIVPVGPLQGGLISGVVSVKRIVASPHDHRPSWGEPVPLPGATATLVRTAYERGGGEATVAESVSDELGAFSFPDTPPGNYALRARHPDHPDARPFAGIAMLGVNGPASEFVSIEFLEQAPPIRLRGVVVRHGVGTPVAGASIEFGTVEGRSGPDGRFSLPPTRLPKTASWLVVILEGEAPVSLAVADPWASLRVEIPERPACRLGGHVLSFDGRRPVSGRDEVEVLALHPLKPSAPPPLRRTVIVGADGSFAIDGLWPGAYLVRTTRRLTITSDPPSLVYLTQSAPEASINLLVADRHADVRVTAKTVDGLPLPTSCGFSVSYEVPVPDGVVVQMASHVVRDAGDTRGIEVRVPIGSVKTLVAVGALGFQSVSRELSPGRLHEMVYMKPRDSTDRAGTLVLVCRDQGERHAVRPDRVYLIDVSGRSAPFLQTTETWLPNSSTLVLEGLRFGRTDLLFSAFGYAPVRIRGAGPALLADANPIPVAFRRASAQISGQTTDAETGEPLSGVTIYVIPDSADFEPRWLSTDARAAFVASESMPSGFEVKAAAGPVRLRFWREDLLPLERVVAAPAGQVSVVLRRRPGASPVRIFSGTAVDALSGSRLKLVRWRVLDRSESGTEVVGRNEWGIEVFSGEGGEFLLKPRPDLELELSAPGYETRRFPVIAKENQRLELHRTRH